MSASQGTFPSPIGVFFSTVALVGRSTSDIAGEILKEHDVLKLTYPSVLDVLAKRIIGPNNSRLAKMVTFVIFVYGTYETVRNCPLLPWAKTKISSHFSAEIAIEGSHPLNKDVLT